MPQNDFDESVAPLYDATQAAMSTPEVLAPTVDFLVDAARGGAALELAIGTGRVALPLAARGVEVHGIEISTAMVQQLRAKAGGGEPDMPVTIGDIATTRLGRQFRLVYLVFNTISNLLEQAEQVECFRRVAEHLEPGGRFVIELGVPGLRRLPPGERFVPFDVTADHLGFDEYEPARQLLTSHHVWIERGRALTFASRHRYVWPAELDLMAQLGGLRFVERWADWDRSPFTDESTGHVSVWERPGRAPSKASDWTPAASRPDAGRTPAASRLDPG